MQRLSSELSVWVTPPCKLHACTEVLAKGESAKEGTMKTHYSPSIVAVVRTVICPLTLFFYIYKERKWIIILAELSPDGYTYMKKWIQAHRCGSLGRLWNPPSSPTYSPSCKVDC